MHVGVVFSKTFLWCPSSDLYDTNDLQITNSARSTRLGPHRLMRARFLSKYRVFSHDVTVDILVSQNNEAAAMLVSQTSPVGVELLMQTFSFVPINLHRCWPPEWKHSIHLFQLRLLPWNMMHDAWWFAFHGLRCIVVDLLVMFVHAVLGNP